MGRSEGRGGLPASSILPQTMNAYDSHSLRRITEALEKIAARLDRASTKRKLATKEPEDQHLVCEHANAKMMGTGRLFCEECARVVITLDK